MDTKVIEARKNVIISSQLILNTSLSFNINTVPFIPDEVIVKQVIYNPAIADPIGWVLYSDVISDNIACVYQNSTSLIDNHFILKKPVNQTWTFTFNTANTGGITGTNTISGYLFIQLEFIKYRDVKQEKIY